MIKSFLIICCLALFIVASVFIAGGLTHEEREKSSVSEQFIEQEIQIPLTFSKTTGFEEVKLKPLRIYLSER
ncbi:hypothetical protein AVL50_07505 [Flammeovirga sp. SJP92]|nr:hypothetical protein AVL50_07505 [Flammeovirga sp. SJP92]